MRISQAFLSMQYITQAQLPCMLHGSPGVGKSDIVRQLAVADKYDSLFDIRLSQYDSVDLRGVPSVNTKSKTTTWNPPDTLPRSGRHIIFLDELNSAAQSVMAAAYQLILDRRIGDYHVPEGCVIIAAGNRMTDRAIVNSMGSALNNRFVHIDVDANIDDWCSWAYKTGIHESIIAALKYKPSLLNAFDDATFAKQIANTAAFHTPRTWSYADKLVKIDMPENILNGLLVGTIGETAAMEYMAYTKYYAQIPAFEDILAMPTKTPVPKEPAVLYSLATSLASKLNTENFEPVLEYLFRMQVEFQVMTIKDAIGRDGKLVNTASFGKWAVKNSSVIF